MTSLADNEDERLQVLLETGILLTEPNPVLDAICREAKRRFDVPIALITLVDRRMLRVKAAQGLDVSELPRDTAFCAYTIRSDHVFVIPNMLADERFRANPLVVGEPHLRFYAGAPLVYMKGIRLGSLCLLDVKTRLFSLGDRAELMEIADRTVTEIAAQELRALEPTSTGLP